MGGALNEVELIKVIGLNPAHEQLVDERLHGVQIVVHTTKKHTLIAERNAVVGKAFESFFHLGRQFARVIGVNADEKGMVFLQHLTELWSDALRKKYRDPGSDAEKFDVFDLAESIENLLKLPVGE